ncbi:hypothetical protein Tco_1236328 [Tanacetum coccineum]
MVHNRESNLHSTHKRFKEPHLSDTWNILSNATSSKHSPAQPMFQLSTLNSSENKSYNAKDRELIWEEFTQVDPTFFSHKASHKAAENPKKVTPLLIPYGRFSKVIIYYLASNNNIHRRPDSAVHHTGDDYILGNLKFVPKGESVEVKGRCWNGNSRSPDN